MRTKSIIYYLIVSISAFLIAFYFSFNKPAAAQVPTDIKNCLKPSPLFITPAKYEEIAKVKYNNSVFYYMNVLYSGQKFPSGQILLSSSGVKCKKYMISPTINQSLLSILPKQIAIYLAEKKWKSLLKYPDGKYFLDAIINPKISINNMGEVLDPVPTSPEDIIALRNMGYSLKEKSYTRQYGG